MNQCLSDPSRTRCACCEVIGRRSGIRPAMTLEGVRFDVVDLGMPLTRRSITLTSETVATGAFCATA